MVTKMCNVLTRKSPRMQRMTLPHSVRTTSFAASYYRPQVVLDSGHLFTECLAPDRRVVLHLDEGHLHVSGRR